MVGVLGGSAGTTHDAFTLLHDARRHGARVALFGRKINAAEDQLSFVQYLRMVADDQIFPRSGEGLSRALQTLGLTPYRSLDKDLELTFHAGLLWGLIQGISSYRLPEKQEVQARWRGGSPCTGLV